MVATPLGQLRPTLDVFRDEDSKSGTLGLETPPADSPLTSDAAFEPPSMAPQLKREPRSALIAKLQMKALANENRYGDHFAMQAVNPITHSNISSPSPSLRDIPPRTGQDRDARSRYQPYPYYGGGHLPFRENVPAARVDVELMCRAPFPRNDDDFSMHDPTLYSNVPRLPYGAYNGAPHDPYRMHPSLTPAMKQDLYSPGISGDVLANNESNLFLNFPSASPNPLQERPLFNAFHGSAQQSGSPLGFTPINRERDYSYTAAHGAKGDEQGTPSQIKLEPQAFQTAGSDNSSDSKEHIFGQSTTRAQHGSEDDLPLHDDLSRASAA